MLCVYSYDGSLFHRNLAYVSDSRQLEFNVVAWKILCGGVEITPFVV